MCAMQGAGKFTEGVSEDIVFMLSYNLFRTLPPARSHDVDNFDAEEEEPSLDPAWPHLQACYGCTGTSMQHCFKWKEHPKSMAAAF